MSPVFLTDGQFLSTVAAFWTLLPSRKGCNSMERAVMGDLYRYRNDTNRLGNFQVVDVSWLSEFFFMQGGLLPRRLRGRCCAQSTDVLALVMRFCVQLLLNRGATTPSSSNTIKKKLGHTQSLFCTFVPGSFLSEPLFVLFSQPAHASSCK